MVDVSRFISVKSCVNYVLRVQWEKVAVTTNLFVEYFSTIRNIFCDLFANILNNNVLLIQPRKKIVSK